MMPDQSVKDIERLIQDPTFRLWCLEEGSPELNQKWENWIASSKYRQNVAETAKKIVLELEKIYDPISARYKYKAWEKLADRINNTSTTNNLSVRQHHKYDRNLGWKFSIAASIAVFLVSCSLVIFANFSSQSSEEHIQEAPEASLIVTDFGEKKYISLSDGSRIILNANSSLTHYDGWHYDKKIKVRLKGEAHFDVVERTSETAPVFQVETQDGNINVLGTRFVVSTWDNTTKVILEKGSVAIERRTSNPVGQSNAILHPDEIAEFSKSSDQISIKSVNTEVYTSWIRNMMVFDRTPLSSVAKRIEHTYGKTVSITDSLLLKKKLSGSIETNSIEVVLSALSKILQAPVSQTEEEIIIGEPLLQADSHNPSFNP